MSWRRACSPAEIRVGVVELVRVSRQVVVLAIAVLVLDVHGILRANRLVRGRVAALKRLEVGVALILVAPVVLDQGGDPPVPAAGPMEKRDEAVAITLAGTSAPASLLNVGRRSMLPVSLPTGNIDLRPTFSKLAGADVPATAITTASRRSCTEPAGELEVKKWSSAAGATRIRATPTSSRFRARQPDHV